MFYHGTDNGNLLSLTTQKSNYDGKIFVTDKKEVAIWYTVKTVWYLYGLKNGQISITEFCPDMLKKMYGEKRGFIYTCENKDFTAYESPVPNAYVSTQDVKLTSKEEIPDVYEYILKLSSEGKIKINFYEQATAEQREKRKQTMVSFWHAGYDKLTEGEIEYLKQFFQEELEIFLKKGVVNE